VVIVPILAKGIQEKVTEEAKKLEIELKNAGLRVFLDIRDIRPGAKYFDWEIRGVPLRLELGQRDMERGVVTFARRDTGQKEEVDRNDLISQVNEILKAISSNLWEKASQIINESIISATNIEEARDFAGIVKVGWCGEEGCGLEIEESTEMKVLGTPAVKEDFNGQCVICSKPTEIVAYLAKTY
jgi:prolyl-tRNA synthetase